MKNLNLFVLSLLSIMLFTSCDLLEDIFGNESNFKESSQFSYSENYIEGLDAIYHKDGYIALFGKRNVPIQFDSIGNITNSEELILYIASINENGDVNDADATVVVVDSTYFPTRIVGNGINAVVSRTNNNNCNCLVYDDTADEWKEFKDIEFLRGEISNIDEEPISRAMSTAGSNGFTLTTAINALSLLNSVGGAISNTGIAKIASSVGIFGDVLGSVGFDEIGLGIAVTVGGVPGAVVGGIGYLSSKYDKLKKHFFCDDDKNVKISIENIQQIDRKTVEISYSVEGLNERGLTNSGLFFSLLHVNGMTKEVIILPVNNGYNKKILGDMKSGAYEVDLNLISNEYPLCKYTTKPMLEFNVFDLELFKYEIEEDPIYEDGAVNFKMNVFLKGNEDGLEDIQQFGYYIKYANAMDYKEVKNLSSIFESTPLTYELSIPRDGFSDETINYTTFEAKPSIDYYIGVYVVLKNGNIVHFDEETIEGLVYNRKPSFTISNIVVTDRGPYSDGTGRDSYMSYTVDYSVDGGLFVSEIYRKYGENWDSSGAEYLIFNEFDDNTTNTRKGTINYDSENTEASHISFFAILKNGKKHQFNQGMTFQGGSLNVNGSTRSISFTRTPTDEYPKPLIIIED